MFKIVANFLLDGIRRIVGTVAILIAWIGVKLSGNKDNGIYAVVPVLLAPFVLLHLLHLDRDRDY